LFRLNWLLLAVMLATLDLALLLTDFRIRPTGYLAALVVAAAYGVSGHYEAEVRDLRGEMADNRLSLG
jgi:hypothetical protein